MKKAFWLNAGALAPAAAAFLAASCCLPLGLALLGVSSATLALLIPWRPYLLALTIGLLAAAFYQAYKPLPAAADCTPGEVCARPVSRRGQRIFLWVVAVVSLTLATLPYWLDRLIYWVALLED